MEVSRILIADDVAGTRGALKGLIESHEGWKVCGEAADGAEAVAQMAALAPDVVVLDLTMPRMNGFEAGKAIHAATPNIPLLLFTLHAVDVHMEARARAAGFMGAVSKSSFESILDGIEAVLAGKAFFSAPSSGASSPSGAAPGSAGTPPGGYSSGGSSAGPGNVGKAARSDLEPSAEPPTGTDATDTAMPSETKIGDASIPDGAVPESA
jgi:CheY-like chemotaxis protein